MRANRRYACGSPPRQPASCASNPCAHGICVETAATGFTCQCPFGFEGLSCDTNGLQVEDTALRSCTNWLADVAETLTATCCSDVRCDGGVPTSCSPSCAVVWTPFSKACSIFLDGNFKQFRGFSAACEERQFGSVAGRCDHDFWTAGLQQVFAACCNPRELSCGRDITKLPRSCSLACQPVFEEFYAACHLSSEMNAVSRSFASFLQTCQNRK